MRDSKPAQVGPCERERERPSERASERERERERERAREAEQRNSKRERRGENSKEEKEREGHARQQACCPHLLRQYLYFCTGTASKLSTSITSTSVLVPYQHLCTGTASRSTCTCCVSKPVARTCCCVSICTSVLVPQASSVPIHQLVCLAYHTIARRTVIAARRVRMSRVKAVVKQ
jgi:hypothetical protein